MFHRLFTCLNILILNIDHQFKKDMKVAVVGATGMVGNVMLNVLKERQFPLTELLPVASERSVGQQITFDGKNYNVIGLAEAVSQRPDIAIFSAGGETSLEWAPKFGICLPLKIRSLQIRIAVPFNWC